MTKAKEIKLTDKERSLIRNNILNFIRTESIRKEMQASGAAVARRSWFGLRPGSLSYRIVPTALILVILISGGTAFAAQSSLPGDILYPIKVDVTEKVQGALVLSNEDKANWEAELAQRRLVEAEELASSGRLNEKTSAEVQKRLSAHTKASADIVSELNTRSESESAAKVASSLEASLEVHEKILSGISDEDTPDDTSDNKKERSEQIRPILNAIRTDLSAVTKSRIETETDMSARAEMEKQKSSERAMQDARIYVREAENFLQKNKSAISDKAYDQATEDIKLAHDALSSGEAQAESKEYADAFASFQESIRTSQKVRLSVEAALRSETRSKAKRTQEDNKNRQESRRRGNSKDKVEPSPLVSPSKSPEQSDSQKSFWRRMIPSPTPHTSPEVETKSKTRSDDSDSEIKIEIEGTGNVGL